MILGTYFPNKEDKYTEFKEFYLKLEPSIFLDGSQIESILQNGVWEDKMNFVIANNVKHYFQFYVPKYVSCYLNSNISGKLIFGVNDDSEITGIPYKGDINNLELDKLIKNNLSKYVRGLDNLDNVTINVNKLNIDRNLIDLNEFDDMFSNIKQNKLKHTKDLLEYKLKRNNWLHVLSKYTTKFYNILNDKDMRLDLTNFCKSNNVSKNIIDILESNDSINVNLDEEFYKNVRNPDSIFYWAGKFKDENILRIQKQKPVRNTTTKLVDYSILLNKISNMRSKFVLNNDINYYTITININNFETNNVVEFKLPGCNEWNTRYRISLPTGPSCI